MFNMTFSTREYYSMDLPIDPPCQTEIYTDENYDWRAEEPLEEITI